MVKLWKQDISFLRQAKHLQKKGYSVLMYDLSNHGESDRGKCPWISWGPNEAKDIVAAVDFVSEHQNHGNANIGLLSVCMGAAASTYAFGMGDIGLKHYANIKAMFAVQPLHYNKFVKAFGIPRFMNRSGLRVSNERLGFDLSVRTFMDDVKSINVPTLVMQNQNDPWTDHDFVRRYHNQLTVEKEFFRPSLTKDRAAAYEYLCTHPEKVSEFFEKHL